MIARSQYHHNHDHWEEQVHQDHAQDVADGRRPPRDWLAARPMGATAARGSAGARARAGPGGGGATEPPLDLPARASDRAAFVLLLAVSTETSKI